MPSHPSLHVHRCTYFYMLTGLDAFDFDAEVEPILEVLVGKTLEQSMRKD